MSRIATFRITIVASWREPDAPDPGALLDVFTDNAARLIVDELGCEPPKIDDGEGVTVEEL